MTRVTVLLLAVIFLGGAELRSQAPFGWRAFEHVRSGVRFHHPKEFDAVPVQPTEHLIIAKLQREKPFRAKRNERDRRPESLQVFVLSDPVTDGGKKDDVVRDYDDVVARQNAIHDFGTFMKARFGRVKYEKDEEARLKDDETEYRITSVGERLGYVYVRKVPGFTFGVIGFADEPVKEHFRKLYRALGRTIERPSGYDEEIRDDSLDFYRFKDYRDVAFRAKARRNMVRGWKAHDTENFFIVYSTRNERLIKKLANDLEAVRPLFEEMFPPVAPIEAVSVVRVCEDPKEYARYGGPPGSAGYWNFVAKELVLFDSDRGNTDSYVVLYHEAFHQYIFYALGELSPDYWFNEGNADFFSGVEVYRGSKRIKGIGPNPWRIPTIEKTLKAPARPKLKELLFAKRPQYYDPRRMGLMYAYGWALCYFLHRSEAAEAEPLWHGLIDRYYAALKTARAEHVDVVPESATLAERTQAQDRARAAATKVALEGVDLEALEKAWDAWMAELVGAEGR